MKFWIRTNSERNLLLVENDQDLCGGIDMSDKHTNIDHFFGPPSAAIRALPPSSARMDFSESQNT